MTDEMPTITRRQAQIVAASEQAAADRRRREQPLVNEVLDDMRAIAAGIVAGGVAILMLVLWINRAAVIGWLS